MRFLPAPSSRARGRTALFALLVTVAGPAAQAMTINVTYDASITARPNAATIQTAIDDVTQQFEAAIANDITVMVHVAWGKVNTTPLAAGDVGETLVSATGFYSFAQVGSFLGATGATLPAANPTGTNRFLIPTAVAEALNIPGVSYPAYDAYIGFSATAPFAYDDTAAIPALSYDFKGIASHEIQHALGRVTGLFSTSPIYGSAADLFRYTAAGTNSFTYDTPVGGAPAYASTDGGVTSLGTYSDQTTGANRADWQSPTGTANPPNAQNGLQATGVDYCLSTADQRLLAALGYEFTADAAALFLSGPGCAPAGASPAAYAAFPVAAPVGAPEPGTLALLTAGSATLGVLRRRRACG